MYTLQNFPWTISNVTADYPYSILYSHLCP
jgi:hypothetical protein